jgi:hypothetical protein
MPEAEILKPFGEFKTPGRQEEVAKMLRRLADEADRGEIIGAAVATINRNEDAGTFYQPGSAGWARLIGSLALLQHIMMKNWDA